jgi:AraC family transcriptional regulator, transcriptional activator of pobA
MQKKNILGTKIKKYHFLPHKYGRHLQLDIGHVETLKNYVLDDTLHQLSFYEILFIEKGKGYFMLDESKILIAPGTIVFTSPGQLRQWNLEKKVSGYTLFFEKDFLTLFFTDELFLYRFQYFHQYTKPTGVQMDTISFRQTLELVRRIEEEFMQLQNDSNHMMRALLYQLLVALNRFYAASYNLERDTYIHPDFFRFRSLLENQFMVQHRVAAYVQLLKISPAHLNKICRQYSGLSAQQIIHHKLITEIKKQLRSGLSANEIAYKMDFSDPSNFNRFFKKLTGTTPQGYKSSL